MDDTAKYLAKIICVDIFDYDEPTWINNMQYAADLYIAQPPLSTLKTYQLEHCIAYCAFRLQEGNTGPDSQYFTEGHSLAKWFWSLMEELTARKLAKLNANVADKPLDPDLDLPL